MERLMMTRNKADKGYSRVDNDVFEKCGITCKDGKPAGAYGLAVYLVLAKYANYETELCWPSLATIAKESYVNRRTVIRTIARLAEVGVIEIQSRKRDNGEPDSNMYRLPRTKVGSDSQSLRSDQQSLPVVTHSHVGSDSQSPKRTLSNEHKRKEPNLTLSIESHDYCLDAMNVWQAIHTPRGGPTEIRKAWASVLNLPKDDRPSEPDLYQSCVNYMTACHAADTWTKQMKFFLSPSSRPYEEYLPANYHPDQQPVKPSKPEQYRASAPEPKFV
jgi:hypothetical protein